ncbi:PREDICTED: uncharacterized protein LOC100632164 [Amphimedon queenslandica]|uniref:Uncharacterized protein n=1 Tax=Amphimedon queenslandica TaxID=400682 RepID=A0A1X7UMS4_AMPQE|nr:PREDICTED: uncharacterized protein LOC100632164 [Amphimedon queenslandica]|eukprot:XP_011404618.2 PREDICTED: uncharacterized protein LOC100632164 [Amphimedon queenslandica]
MAELSRSSCKMERRLRPRVSKCYSESLYDEEEEEGREGRSYSSSSGGGRRRMSSFSYNILEKLKEERFTKENGLVKHFPDGTNLSCKYLQSTGFLSPMVFHSKEGLQMKLPPHGFSVHDVKHLVGSERMVDVVDSTTQEALNMSLSEYCNYYQKMERSGGDMKRILNVISLEFSHTQLDPLVEAPLVVREMDWVNKVWPRSLRQKQSEPTNDIKRMLYPKVQKYCLMSVAGCYTDFHLDFGGTSVWYHILKGEKIFFLVPPSHSNYTLFLDWQKNGRQECIFFPDIVRDCGVVHLKEGDTLLLPSGWIHGVYTPKQSLVFGGNFLLSLHICQQLTVAYMERDLKVQGRFKYPFYGTLHWYLIERYHLQLSRLGVEPMSDSGTMTDTPTSSSSSMNIPGRWLVSVKLKKLATGGHAHFSSHFSQKPGEGAPYRDYMMKPFLNDNEKAGLVYLVNKMKEDNLFSGDVPPSISDPRGILERLSKQLQNPLLDSTLSDKPTDVSVLDDFQWLEGDRNNNAQAGLFGDVALGGVPIKSEDVNFDDDDFLASTDLLRSYINPESIPDQNFDSETKPILRVNHDHSYGQFVTPSDPAHTDSSHLLIAESPTHLSTDQLNPDYPLITLNPTHSLTTPPVPPPTSFPFDHILPPSSSSTPLTPLTSSLLTSRPSLPLLSLLTSSSQQLEPPLSAGIISTPSLSSPSPSPTTPAKPFLLSNLKRQFFHSEATPILSDTTPTLGDTTPTVEGSATFPSLQKPVKKRKKSTKDSVKPLRKVRCGQCPECMSEPCGTCKFCLDSPKYGGTGKLRKACLRRRCSNMQFSKTSSTVISPLTTTPTTSSSGGQLQQSLHCEADSTTTLGEDLSHLPTQTTPTTPMGGANELLKLNERGGLETTVMAMGYAAINANSATDCVGDADIDLNDILSNSDTNLFTASSQHQFTHEVLPAGTDPLLTPPPFIQSFLSSPSFQSSSPFPSASLNPTHNQSPLLMEHEFQLHFSDEDFRH